MLSSFGFTKVQKETIDASILMKYLQTQGDIVGCPNANCKYYGFFKETDDKCENSLCCPTCGNEWQLGPAFSEQLIDRINGVFLTRILTEILSYFYQELFTENCPQCMISISRNGGCYHMTCKNCNHQFCWYCKQKYEGHKLNLCLMHLSVKLALLTVVAYWVLGCFGCHRTVWDGSIFAIYFAIKYIVFYNLVLVMFVSYSIYVYQYFKLANDPKRRKTEAGVIIFGSVSLLVLIFLIRKGSVIDCLYWWAIEVSLMAVLYNLHCLYAFMDRNWISLVE